MDVQDKYKNDENLDEEYEILCGVKRNPFFKDVDEIVSGPEFPPWTEWNDALINREDWNLPTILDGISVFQLASEINNDNLDKNTFSDPSGHCKLPPNIPVDRYLRVRWQHLFMVWTPPDYRICPTDLISPNYHLLQYPEMKAIITAIMNLEMLADSVGFAIEYTSDQFIPNGNEPWRPWHHVYSRCKVGKGTKHQIVINPNGKYIVRLFYLGCWRRIYVDDFMPIDVNGRHLLPISQYPELWPVLLSKALLKINSLYSKDQFNLHFLSPTPMDPIIHLTGWCSDVFVLNDVSISNIWMLIQKLMSRDGEVNELETENLNVIYSRVKMLSKKIDYAIEESITDPIYENLGPVAIVADINGLESLKKTNFSTSTLSLLSNVENVYLHRVSQLCNTIKNTQNNMHESEEEDDLDELRPCIPHSIIICQATSKLLNNKEAMPRWKMFRWVEWAKKNGLYEEKQNIYSMQIYSAFKKKKIPIKIPKSPYNKLWELDSKIPYYAKHMNKKEKITHEIEVKPIEQPQWIRMEELISIFKFLHVYFRPSSFRNQWKINSENPNGVLIRDMKTSINRKSLGLRKESVKERKESIKEYNQNLQESFRFYLYCDCPVSKKIYIQLSVLSEQVIKNEMYEQFLETSSSKELESDLTNQEIDKSIFYLFLNTFDWTNRGQLGKPIYSLQTSTIGGRIFTLAEGQVALEVIYDVPKNFEILILSQAPIKIYNYNNIMEKSLNLTNSLEMYSMKIKNVLNLLKRFVIGSNEYIKNLENFFDSLLPEHIPIPGRDPRYPKRIPREIIKEFQRVIIDVFLNENRQYKTILEQVSIIENLCYVFNSEEFGMNYLEETHPHLFNLIKEKCYMKSCEEISEINYKNQIRASRFSQKRVKLNWLTDKIILHPTRDIMWLLKKMFIDKPNLLYLYSFRSELTRKNLMNEYRGIYRNLVNSVDFYVLFRFFVNTFAEEPTYTSIDLHCENIEGWTLCIINNDTKEELSHSHPFRVGRNFIKNNLGYTIYGYAYHSKELPKEIPWRLRLWYKEDVLPLHPCSMNKYGECIYDPRATPTNMVTQVIQGHYIPNRKTSICMAILKIYAPQWIILRLWISRPKVKFFIKICSLENPDKEIFLTAAQGAIVVPHLWLNPNELKLEHDDDPDESLSSSNKNYVEYLIECFTRPFLWTLTENETNLVTQVEAKQLESMRVFDESTIDIDKLNSKAEYLKKNESIIFCSSEQKYDLANQILVDPPKWSLQIVIEQSKSMEVILEEDRRRQEAFKLVKMIWEEDNPNRYKRGFMLRHEFQRERIENVKAKSRASYYSLPYLLNSYERYNRFLTMDLSDEHWPPENWIYVSKMIEIVKKTQPDIQETVNSFVNNLSPTINDEDEAEEFTGKREKIIKNLYNYCTETKKRIIRMNGLLKKSHEESQQNLEKKVMDERNKIFNTEREKKVSKIKNK